MPYQAERALLAPTVNTTIWRHIDIAKLVSLLSTQSLWFASVSKLEDRFEGSYPAPNAERRRAIAKRTVNLGAPAALRRTYEADFLRDLRRQVYVNCWYSGDHESAALWQYASRSGASVAIKSTFGALTTSIRCGRERFYAGRVRYRDYNTQRIPEGHVLSAFFFKRRSYEHEREVRAVFYRSSTPQPGFYVRVDVRRLAKAIVIDPLAPTFIREVVESLVSRYGLHILVQQSELDADPVW